MNGYITNNWTKQKQKKKSVPLKKQKNIVSLF